MAALTVVDTETDETVEAFDVTGWTEGRVDRLERGLLRNMDRDRFVVRRED